MKRLIATSAMMGILICNGCLPLGLAPIIAIELHSAYKNSKEPDFDGGDSNLAFREKVAEAQKKAREEQDIGLKAEEEKAKAKKAKLDALKEKAALEETQEN